MATHDSTCARPPRYRCTPACDHAAHARLRRLARALDELEDAADDLIRHPYRKGGYAVYLAEDLRGLLWAASIASGLADGEAPPCCYSERRIAEEEG